MASWLLIARSPDCAGEDSHPGSSQLELRVASPLVATAVELPALRFAQLLREQWAPVDRVDELIVVPGEKSRAAQCEVE
jgi:hypothetical protein